MKQLLLSLGIITLGLSSCAEVTAPPSLHAVLQAADAEVFVGIDKNTEAELVIASRQLGPFQQVKQLNFIIENGIYKDMKANVIVVQHKGSKTWEVVRLMVEDNGQWKTIARTKNNAGK